MAYLLQKDFLRQIQADNLSQIIGNNQPVLSNAIQTAVEEATSYLIQKYDVSCEFADFKVWSPSETFNANDRIYLDAPEYNAGAAYNINDLSIYKGDVYLCAVQIPSAEDFNKEHWTLIGQQYSIYYAALPFPMFDFYNVYYPGQKVFLGNKIYTALEKTTNIFPNEMNVSTIWDEGVDYAVPPGTALSVMKYWKPGDNRSQQMVVYCIDIALYHIHSRISPRNIPELRVKRYDDAIDWFLKAGQGKITANLPVLQPKQGMRIRYGGNKKIINSY